METLPIEIASMIMLDAYKRINESYVRGMLICKYWYDILSHGEKYVDFKHFRECYAKYGVEIFLNRVECENKHIDRIRDYMLSIDPRFQVIRYQCIDYQNISSIGLLRKDDLMKITIKINNKSIIEIVVEVGPAWLCKCVVSTFAR